MLCSLDTSARQAQRTRVTVLALGLLAIALYAPMIGWGIPYATAPDRTRPFSVDDILPLEPLAEMHNTFVISKPDRNYGYPWWHYFVVAVAYAPYLGYLKLSGVLSNPSPRLPVWLAGPGLVPAGADAHRTHGDARHGRGHAHRSLWLFAYPLGHRAGVIAAVLTSLNYLMWYYSRTGNLEVPAFFWSSIGCVIFATILVKGLTVRRAIGLGMFAGLAMATKDQALVCFLPFAVLLLLPRFNHAPGAPYQTRAVLGGLGAFLVAYLIGTGMVVDPQRHITHVYSLFFDQRRVTNASLYRPPYPKTWPGILMLTHAYGSTLLAGLSGPVLLVALGGALLALRTVPHGWSYGCLW